MVVRARGVQVAVSWLARPASLVLRCWRSWWFRWVQPRASPAAVLTCFDAVMRGRLASWRAPGQAVAAATLLALVVRRCLSSRVTKPRLAVRTAVLHAVRE